MREIKQAYLLTICKISLHQYIKLLSRSSLYNYMHRVHDSLGCMNSVVDKIRKFYYSDMYVIQQNEN